MFSSSIVKNHGVRIEQTPQSELSTDLFLKVAPLSLMDAQNIYNSKIEGKLFFFNINKLPAVKRIIKKHTLIISSEFEKEKKRGTKVKPSEIGANIYMNNGNYYSSVEGFLIYENSLYKVLEVLKDAAFSIKVSDDSMRVICNFFPPAKNHKNISFDDISKEFRKLKITAHPDIKVIDKYLKELGNADAPVFNVVIASGSNPEPGRDGRVEYLIETEKSNKPTVTGSGRVDFYNLSTIHSVAQDQKLAIIHPPVPGKAGVDVFGRITPAAPVKKAPNPKGSNTYFDDKAPNILLAKIGGYISKLDGKLSISEEYKVRGNVDFHTGNIISKGAVNINGDVRSGFKLDLDKSITINGFVNDADLKSKGSIDISGGFGGSGKGKIFAVGNVSVRFVRNQSIYSQADIIIAKEAVDAKLYAKGSIKSMNGQAIIIGGTIVAEHDVLVNTIGNEFSVKTKIQVGSNFELIEKSYALSLEIKELKAKLTEKGLRVKKYTNVKNLSNTAKQRLSIIFSEYKELKMTLTKLENQQKAIKDILRAPTQAKVEATGTIYPGVEILIQNTLYKVKEKLYHKTFKLSETEKGIIQIV